MGLARATNKMMQIVVYSTTFYVKLIKRTFCLYDNFPILVYFISLERSAPFFRGNAKFFMKAQAFENPEDFRRKC